MCITRDWLGQQWLHQSNYISSCLEISSAYNPFSPRFPFPVVIHLHNVCWVNGLHNIPPLLPPGDHVRVQNSRHLLEYKLFKAIPTV